jgi:hypothetical protein
MRDFHTQKRQAWLRELQSRQAATVELSSGQIIREFLGAVALFAIPLAMLFLGAALGFE